MPADNYYPEAPAEMGDTATTASQETPADTQGRDAKEENSETALVPLSFFGGTPPEPGQTCTVKVSHVYEDEAEIEYVDSADEGEGEEREYGVRPGRPRAGMEGAMDRLEMMKE